MNNETTQEALNGEDSEDPPLTPEEQIAHQMMEEAIDWIHKIDASVPDVDCELAKALAKWVSQSPAHMEMLLKQSIIEDLLQSREFNRELHSALRELLAKRSTIC